MPEWVASRPHHKAGVLQTVSFCGDVESVHFCSRTERMTLRKWATISGEAFGNQEAVDYLKQQQYSDTSVRD